jgi:hypothetical protein
MVLLPASIRSPILKLSLNEVAAVSAAVFEPAVMVVVAVLLPTDRAKVAPVPNEARLIDSLKSTARSHTEIRRELPMLPGYFATYRTPAEKVPSFSS